MRNADAGRYIAGRDNFTASHFAGVRKMPYESPDSYGQLPYEYVQDVAAAAYVIYSYATPIAWWVKNCGWFCPAVRYSQTTSRHQNIVRASVQAVTA